MSKREPFKILTKKQRRTLLRKHLRVIEDMLLGPAGADLSMVLSALRGPDNNDTSLKMDTTAVIRTVAFPRLATRVVLHPDSAGHNWVFAEKDKPVRVPPSAFSPHFISHINSAVRALGLV